MPVYGVGPYGGVYGAGLGWGVGGWGFDGACGRRRRCFPRACAPVCGSPCGPFWGPGFGVGWGVGSVGSVSGFSGSLSAW